MRLYFIPMPFLADIALPQRESYILIATVLLAGIDVMRMLMIYRLKRLHSLEDSKKQTDENNE